MQYFFEEDYFRTAGRDYDASFTDYRHAERRLHYPGAHSEPLDILPGSQPANPDLQLVDAVYQATRHQAPEVSIDNMAHDDKTRIDVIAGNRPGSLLEVRRPHPRTGAARASPPHYRRHDARRSS
jgi:hypothetical protein